MTAPRSGAAARAGRSWAALSLLASGGLLLASTQPWVRTLRQAAEGTPLSRGAVSGAELVPWLAPAGLVAGLAVVVGLTGVRWARPLALAATLAALVGTVAAVVAATGARTPVAAGLPELVWSSRTAWAWVGLGTAAASVLGTTAWWTTPRGGRGGPSSRRRRRPAPAVGDTPSGGVAAKQDPHGHEAERRRRAADWRALSEGRDPTEP